MVKSCIHTVWWPELHQNMPYLSPYHRPVPNSAKLHENIEIPRKWTNSAARLKIPCSTENCGPYCRTPVENHCSRDNIIVTGDAHSQPTPSLNDQVEPLQKTTKGKILIVNFSPQ